MSEEAKGIQGKMDVFKRVHEALCKYEGQGGIPERLRVSDEVWDELAAEVERIDREQEQGHNEIQAFLFEVADSFPTVPVRRVKKWERRKLVEGCTVYGLPLERTEGPGYVIEVLGVEGNCVGNFA